MITVADFLQRADVGPAMSVRQVGQLRVRYPGGLGKRLLFVWGQRQPETSERWWFVFFSHVLFIPEVVAWRNTLCYILLHARRTQSNPDLLFGFMAADVWRSIRHGSGSVRPCTRVINRAQITWPKTRSGNEDQDMTEKTHYRKAFNSPYLSSADITDTTRLTVHHVCLEPDRTKKTKDHFNTAHFVEKEIRPGEALKPMILNATNSKTMKKITGSAFIDDWNQVAVNIYVDPAVRFGKETVEGLRIAKGTPLGANEGPATQEQLSIIQEYLDTDPCIIPVVTLKWLEKQESLTVKQAATLITKLNKLNRGTENGPA